MRILTLIAAAGLLGTGLTTAAAAPADPCLDLSAFGAGASQLEAGDGTLYISIQGPDCTDGGAATVVDPTGATSSVPFTNWDVGDANHGPASYGQRPVPLATGAGIWKVTALLHGDATATFPVPVQVRVARATAIVLDADPLVVAPGNRAVVTGVLSQYTSRGTRLPLGVGNQLVATAALLQHLDTRVTRSGTTDSAGRFRITLPLAGSSQLGVSFAGAGPTVPGTGVGGQVVMQRQVRLMSADTAPSQFVPTKIKAIAWPAGTRMNLEQWYESDNQWVRIQYGSSDSTGWLTLTDSPQTVGPQRLRLIVYGYDSGPNAVREWSRVIRYPTALDGTTAATSATVIRPGTKMSAYGHLKISKFGHPAGYEGQRVDLQTRPRGQTGTPYTTVATAMTSGATGYYYTNWTARSDVDVRVQFLSVDADVKSAWTYLRAIDVR